MGRIWRDGQKKACTVWRLLTTGTQPFFIDVGNGLNACVVFVSLLKCSGGNTR